MPKSSARVSPPPLRSRRTAREHSPHHFQRLLRSHQHGIHCRAGHQPVFMWTALIGLFPSASFDQPSIPTVSGRGEYCRSRTSSTGPPLRPDRRVRSTLRLTSGISSQRPTWPPLSQSVESVSPRETEHHIAYSSLERSIDCQNPSVLHLLPPTVRDAAYLPRPLNLY